MRDSLQSDRRYEEKTLTQLEQDDWGACASESEITQRLFRLRHKPLKLLEPADLRTAIRFGVGMDYVLPITLDLLWSDPWLDSGNYPGDLLEAVLRAGSDFSQERPDYYRAVKATASEAVRAWEGMDAESRKSSEVDGTSIKKLLKSVAKESFE